MNRRLIRFGALGASGVVVAGGLVLGAGAASAAPSLGTVSVNPASGAVSTPFAVNTSAGCPATSHYALAQINATGWSNVALVGRTNAVPLTGPFSLPSADSLFGIAQGGGLTLNAGQYHITVYCLAGATTSTANADGQFDGSIFVTGTPSQGANQPFQTADPAAATSTTTLTATPAAADSNTPVTLKATVASPAPGTNTGTVQFKDGAANLGSPVTVTGGIATLPAATYTAGSHSFSAVYSGDQETSGSTGTLTYAVTGPLTATTISVAAPAAIAALTPATFTVTTTPAGASGPVTLTEGGITIGTGSATGGTGTVTTTFTTAGSHTVVANFAPTGAFSPSHSANLVVTVGAFAGATATETIETTVAAGSLTISVNPNPKVILPTPVLDQTAGLLVTTGKINAVTVTDTRAGAPGFTVSGVVTDFTDGAATPKLINGFNLGWVPNKIDAGAGMTITPGPAVLPAPGIQPGTTPVNPANGLKTPRVLATDAAGGIGTTHLGADLTLNVPTNTPAATYDTTLTLTAI